MWLHGGGDYIGGAYKGVRLYVEMETAILYVQIVVEEELYLWSKIPVMFVFFCQNFTVNWTLLNVIGERPNDMQEITVIIHGADYKKQFLVLLIPLI